MFVDLKKESKRVSTILKELFPSGYFTARDVVDAARPKSSPLHEYFEWSNEAAAELYRLDQARKIIQCVVVKVGDETVREFHNVFVKEDDRRMYVRVDKARVSADLWEQVLESALSEAVAWKRRYENLTQLSPIMAAITKVEREHHDKKENRTKGKSGRTKDHDPRGRVQGRQNNVGRRVAVTR